GLRLGVSCEVPQDHHRPQFLRQAADGLLQGQGVIGIRTGALRQSLLPGQAPPAPQLPVARVQHDPGEPGLKKVRLTQLPQSPQGLVYALVHRLQGVGLAAQVQVRRPVQPGPESLRPAGEFVVIHGGPPFSSLHLFESQAAGFVCGGGKFFHRQAERRCAFPWSAVRLRRKKSRPGHVPGRDASAPGRSRPGAVFAVQRRGDRQRRALPAGASAGGAGAPLGITPGDGLSDTHPSAG
ncbi:L-lactate utilization operon repressor, partial [Dysosmobacter welbionis]